MTKLLVGEGVHARQNVAVTGFVECRIIAGPARRVILFRLLFGSVEFVEPLCPIRDDGDEQPTWISRVNDFLINLVGLKRSIREQLFEQSN